MHTTYEAAREAFNQALDLEGAAHERYKTAASQADLFAPPEPDAPANGAGAAPSATLPQKTRPRKGNAKPPRRRKPAKGGPEPDGASDQPQS
jgi:hypothetical protein